MGNIIFNGIDFNSNGLVVQTFPNYEFPETEYESVNIEGRNGSLLIGSGTYKNVNRKYYLAGSIPCIHTQVPETATFEKAAHHLINMLKAPRGYVRLEDTYEPDYYRMATFQSAGEVNNIYNEAYTLEVSFNCKPQRYLKSGAEFFRYDNPIENPTEYTSNPLIMFTMSKNYTTPQTVTFYHTENNTDVVVTTVTITPWWEGSQSGYVIFYIDSESKNCYLEGGQTTNINKYISLSNGFPIFKPGISTLYWSPNTLFFSIDIIPRWWTL